MPVPQAAAPTKPLKMPNQTIKVEIPEIKLPPPAPLPKEANHTAVINIEQSEKAKESDHTSVINIEQPAQKPCKKCNKQPAPVIKECDQKPEPEIKVSMEHEPEKCDKEVPDVKVSETPSPSCEKCESSEAKP